MTNLSRRSLFAGFAGLLASTAIPAVMWAQSPLNVKYITDELIRRLDDSYESANYYREYLWSAEEVEEHKRLGGWPEYA